jgi:hypothetical protein
VESKDNNYLQKYVSIGKSLMNANDPLLQNLEAVTVEAAQNGSFCCLIMPSSSWKTQSAFALRTQVFTFR